MGKKHASQYANFGSLHKYTFVEPGQVGCALSCTPAVYMAQNAIPADMKPADLCQMTISDWEEKLGLEELTIFE